MKVMLGPFKSTPNNALLRETELLSISVALEDQIRKNVIRIQTLPLNHPVTLWFERAKQMHRAQIKPISNLEHLMDRNYITTQPLERIRPYIRPPWWENPIHIDIPTSKEIAQEVHEQTFELHRTDPKVMCIYTDGSGIEGEIGAAAYSPTTDSVEHRYLGSADSTNVFAAELVGIQTGLEITEQHQPQIQRCYIYVDSQAAIVAASSPQRQSGQYILACIADVSDRLMQMNPQLRITIQWIPGHRGIHGNEVADEEAKRAATERLGAQAPTNHPTLKSMLIQQARAKSESDNEKIWIEAGKTHHTHYRRITAPPYVKTGSELYDGLSRRNTALLVRLRTGHCALNNYLNRMKITESPICECGHSRETVRHYIVECPIYESCRETLRNAVGARNLRVERLLGQPKFINSSGRFKEIQE